jgi:hypothetical protein
MRIARSEADHFMKWPGFGEWFDISGRLRSKISRPSRRIAVRRHWVLAP